MHPLKALTTETLVNGLIEGSLQFDRVGLRYGA